MIAVFNNFNYSVGNFHNDRARVQKSGKWWHIDDQGNDLYSERFDWVSDFENGTAIAEIDDRRLGIDYYGNETDK